MSENRRLRGMGTIGDLPAHWSNWAKSAYLKFSQQRLKHQTVRECGD